MSNKTVDLAIQISAEASDVSGFGKVSAGAKAMSEDVERAGATAASGFDRAAEGADNLGSKTSQAAGGLGDLGGALAAMPGPLGALGRGMEVAAPAIQGVTGAADLANLALSSNVVVNTKARIAQIRSAVASRGLTVATKAQAIATRVLNLALRANPIGLVITAVLLLIAVFVTLYKRNEAFRALVQNVMRVVGGYIKVVVTIVGKLVDGFMRLVGYVRDRAPAAFEAFKAGASRAVEVVTAPFRKLYDLVRNIIDTIRNIKLPSLPSFSNPFSNPFGRSSASAAPSSSSLMRTSSLAAPAAVSASPSLRRSSIGYGPTIIIQGALDPDAVARQVGDLLERRRVRLGQS